MPNKRNTLPWLLLILLVVLALTVSSLPGPVRGSASAGEALPFDGQVIIMHEPGDGTTRFVPPPAGALRAPATANLVVSYSANFPVAARTAFDFAVGIWESLISSSVPIYIYAEWEPLATNQLGGAGPESIFRNFSGAPMPDTWYPGPLAEKLYGANLSTNPNDADIGATFNSAFPDWYFGTDGNPGPTRVDFLSVVLHELGHGLGFLGYMNASNTTQTATTDYNGFPFVYNYFTENSAGTNLLDISNPATLYNELTGGNIYFDGPHTRAANGGSRVKLYAPSLWQPGSSYSHVDTIYDGTPNALMTWSLADGEAVHDPGPFALGIFADMGWTLDSPTPTTPPPTPTRTATPMLNPASIGYLPGALNQAAQPTLTPFPNQGLYGRVTQNGSAVPNILLTLRRYNLAALAWEDAGVKFTDANGRFDFTGQRGLLPGEAYYVRYTNYALTPSRLFWWATPYQLSYSGGSLAMGDFDIADVALLTPPDGTTVSIPASFTWQRRAATTTDSYAFHLYDDPSLPANEYISPALGYVSEYALTSLPIGFSTGTPNYWDVFVYPPGGQYPDQGWGISLDLYQVTFSSATRQEVQPSASAPAVPMRLPPDVDFSR
ncbi:MAG: hypothetical protein ACK2UW_19720 [Anaerolineales bacterium]